MTTVLENDKIKALDLLEVAKLNALAILEKAKLEALVVLEKSSSCNTLTPLCEEKIRQLDEHLKDSPDRIAEIATNKEKLTQLSKDHEETMKAIEDIRDTNESIKARVAGIELKLVSNQAETKESIRDVANEIKLWVVSGILLGLFGMGGVIVASLQSYGSMNRSIGETTKQVEINTRDIDIIRQIPHTEATVSSVSQKD